jgi:hypothetical protein
MPEIPKSQTPGSSLFAEGQVELELSFSEQTVLTADELASLIDGIQAYHDLLVEASDAPLQPLWVETVRHPNSLILLASAFLVAHKATFIGCASWIGTLAVPYLQLRKSTRDLQKLRLETEREKAKAQPPIPASLAPAPPDSLRQALREALAVAAQLPELSPDERARVIQATVLAKLSTSERAEFQAALKSFGIDQIVSRPAKSGRGVAPGRAKQDS